MARHGLDGASHESTHLDSARAPQRAGVRAGDPASRAARPPRGAGFQPYSRPEFPGDRHLHPPYKALVFCVDEKPQVQTLDRTEPVLPLRSGIPARQTHDDIRHGTTNLFAALNVLEGTVLARCAPKKRYSEFVAFLQQFDRAVPKRLCQHDSRTADLGREP